jgi:predicted SnoaL-like aldol condensation-catalyzing enzyme
MPRAYGPKSRFIANVQMDAERGKRLFSERLADLTAFGRSFIANRYLDDRLGTGAPISESDWTTVYAAERKGYSNYPVLKLESARSTIPSDVQRRCSMAKTTPEQNKTLVLEAFDTLFNKRDYAEATRYWSPDYIQHSALVPPGRDGLFDLVRNFPSELRYENALAIAEGDYVFLHGRFSGNGPPGRMIAADIVRVSQGVLAEHWDVLQTEVTKAESKSGLPMFGSSFPD